MPAPWWGDYVGLSFKRGGRTRAGVDCWGLVRLIYLEQLHVELPLLGDEYSDPSDAAIIAPLVAQHLPSWRQVDAQPFAVALFASAIHQYHVGVMLDAKRMVHAAPGKDVCVQQPAVALMRGSGFYLPLGASCSH